MKLKKALALLSALCIMGAVSACGDSSSKPADSSSKAEESFGAEVTTKGTEAAEKTTTSATTTTEAPLAPAPDGAITFDTTSFYTAEAVNDAGAAPIELAVVDLDGDKKLRIRVKKAAGKEDKDYEVPKVKFDLPTLLGEENVGKIGHVAVDLTFVARAPYTFEDGTSNTVVGWMGGALGGNIAAGKGYDKEGNLIQNDWANHHEFGFEDWENASHTWREETDIPALLPANGYASKDTTYYDKEGNEVDIAKEQNLFFMRWGTAINADIYLDNITFLDKDGKVMEIKYDAAANTVEAEKDSKDSAGSGSSDSSSDSTKPAEETTTGEAAETTTDFE